ncbi:hypothetical protein pipiens_005464 [Culex pipiens pipiens]|uniref:Uncharacterized protein n=1 Tax=Culex pipiens pipiens TaxID=38569 RepID=A0ABD1DYA0_CULPP
MFSPVACVSEWDCAPLEDLADFLYSLLGYKRTISALSPYPPVPASRIRVTVLGHGMPWWFMFRKACCGSDHSVLSTITLCEALGPEVGRWLAEDGTDKDFQCVHELHERPEPAGLSDDCVTTGPEQVEGTPKRHKSRNAVHELTRGDANEAGCFDEGRRNETISARGSTGEGTPCAQTRNAGRPK